jgi:putative GTP pyrophosphokinase
MIVEESVLLIPDKAKLALLYEKSRKGYEEALSIFLGRVGAALTENGLKPTLKSRVKEFESFYSKKLRLLKKAWTEKSGPYPVNDVLAARVVCPFLGDIELAERLLSERFSIEEVERKGAQHSFREFGYESIHVLIRLPEDLLKLCPNLERNVVEVQLRTILQEAWAEVEHELVYKAEFTPFDEPMRRKLAALNANLTLSDIIFQEILEFEKRLTSELGHRREAFYRKIEEVSGELPANKAGKGGNAEGPREVAAPRATAGARETTTGALNFVAGPPSAAGDMNIGGSSEQLDDTNQDPLPGLEREGYQNFGMDGLLLAALEAHNKADFEKAIRIYGEILKNRPAKEISSVVYKHRGMAHFAQSKYKEALEDFSSCLDIDPECYKALYYRGVVKGVLQDIPGAVEDFSGALALHPYHFFSRYRRAESYFKMGDVAAAHADCEIALRIEPKNPLALHLFSNIKEKLALEDF